MSGTTEITQQATAVSEYYLDDGIRQMKHSIIDLLAGAVGATVSVYVGQPLDTVKVKLQTFPSLYPSMRQCFYRTFHKEGLIGLYAGTVPALAANIAENSILFSAYGICQKGVAMVANINRVNDLSPLQNATSGFFAAFFSSLALCPTELVKCRLQAMHELKLSQQISQKSRVTPWTLSSDIFRHEGIPGFFRGFTSTVCREMPGYFVFFGAYEFCKKKFTPQGQDKEDAGPLKTIVCGGCAGTALWISVFPADVAKSRIQVTGSKEPMLRVIFHITKSEGFGALYKGLTPTLIRSFPATGALFLAYEWTKKYLHSALE